MALEIGSIWVMTHKGNSNTGKEFHITKKDGRNYTIRRLDNSDGYTLKEEDIRYYFKPSTFWNV